MATRLTSAAKTDVGLKRTNNEDKFIIVPDKGLYVLCDGMGGHASGEVASALCCSNVAKFVCELARQPGFEFPYQTNPSLSFESKLIVNAIKYANERVYIQSCKDRSMEGMGTTITCIYNAPQGLVLAHVGDSRIYRVRNGQIKQMSRDHSLLNHLIDTGEIKPEDASHFANKNVILRAIGLKDYVDVEVHEVPREVGDVYMMCSDGLSDIVSETKILNAITSAPDMNAACAELISLALQAGGKDNVTVVCVSIQKDDSSQAQPAASRRMNPSQAMQMPGNMAMGQKPGMVAGQPMPPNMAMGQPMPMGQPMQPNMAMGQPMPPNMAMGQPMPMGQPMQPNMAMGQPMPPNMSMAPGMVAGMPQNMAQMPNVARGMNGSYGAMPPVAQHPGMMPMPMGRMVPQPAGMPAMPNQQQRPQRMHSVREVVEVKAAAPAPRPMPKPIGTAGRTTSVTTMPAIPPNGQKPAQEQPNDEAEIVSREDTVVEKAPMATAGSPKLLESAQLSEEEKSQLPETGLLLMEPPSQASAGAETEMEPVFDDNDKPTFVECPVVRDSALSKADEKPAAISAPPRTNTEPMSSLESDEHTKVMPISSGSNPKVGATPSQQKLPGLPSTLASAQPKLDNVASAAIIGMPSDEPFLDDDDDDEPTTVRKVSGFPLTLGVPESASKSQQMQQPPQVPARKEPVSGGIEELADAAEVSEPESSGSAAVKAVHRGYVAPREAITPPKDAFDDGDSIEIGGDFGGSSDDDDDEVTRQMSRPDFTRKW